MRIHSSPSLFDIQSVCFLLWPSSLSHVFFLVFWGYSRHSFVTKPECAHFQLFEMMMSYIQALQLFSLQLERPKSKHFPTDYFFQKCHEAALSHVCVLRGGEFVFAWAFSSPQLQALVPLSQCRHSPPRPLSCCILFLKNGGGRSEDEGVGSWWVSYSTIMHLFL